MSASELQGEASDTYWIEINGTPTQIYCDMVTDGGGWMSFASAPASGGWFSGNTQANWLDISYTYGTYSSTGAIGNYWRDYSTQNVDEVLFKTGNGLYWMILRLADITYPQTYYGANGPGTFYVVASSGNFLGTGEVNSKAYYWFRIGQREDPWINAGNNHAVGNNYMFWGETSQSGQEYHLTFKNANGGIMLFVR
jgi:hypothetical protein